MAAALAVACSEPPIRAAGEAGGAENGGGAAGDAGGTASGGRQNGGSGGQMGGAGGAVEPPDAGSDGAGDAGDDAEPADAGSSECSRDSDCAALTCNGTPRCNAGKCDSGDPCANPDPAHCTVTCVRSGRQAACEVQGKDADGDGHLDAACASGGGDDCNDAEKAIYDGAVEQCDGVDNDCDGKIDAEDDVPLGGAAKVIHESPGTGSLGMVSSPKGFGILSLERRTTRLTKTNTADVLFVDAGGAVVRAQLYGEFADEPTIGFAGDRFHVYDQNGGSGRLQHFSWGSSKVAMQEVDLGVHGRAFSPNAGSDPFVVFVSQYPESWALGYWTNIPILGGFAALTLSTVGVPAQIHRPGYSGWGVAWVESSDATQYDHVLTVQFRSMATGKARLLGSVKVTADNTDYYTALRSETLRPQLAWTGKEHVVGFMNDSGLEFARLNDDGEILCRAQAVEGVSWAWLNSLTTQGSTGIAAVVTSNREPALLRIDDKCGVSAPILLNPGGKKVALGESLKEGKPFLEVGHPVISSLTVSGTRRHGVAWVEDPGTSGLHSVRFRSLGDKLCN